MSRILLVWELGGDYGHIGHLLPLALELRARGHEVALVLRDLAHAENLLQPHGLRAYQAPLWQAEVGGLPPPLNYTEMLLRFGFYSADLLSAMARAWRNLFELLQPDLLVFDHSPTALLASRGLGIPRLMLGNGFFSPPREAPLPPFAWWSREVPAARLADSEQRVTAVANGVLDRLAAPRLGCVADLFEVEADCIAAFPELDHYPARPAAAYVGPLFSLRAAAPAQWPAGPGPRVFAYLKPAHRAFEPMLAALGALDAPVLVHAPGVSARTMKTHQSATLSFSVAPVDMEAARAGCELAVCHAGIGTCAAMLLAGRPMLLLPAHTEQEMMARRIEALGAAVVLHVDQALGDSRRLLRRLAGEGALARQAAAFAARHAGYRQEETLREISGRCLALAGGQA